jgi:SAM-dependent methyltransferase
VIFDRVIWRDDRMLLDNLVFRLQHTRNDAWELGDDCFVFYKVKPLVDQYARFLATRPEFQPRNVFELGLWDGGSVAFWFECFQPHKHVGIDFSARGDSAYFRRYVESRGLAGRIATHWSVDQADGERLRAIARQEFDGPLDLVIDDASHLYGPTRASFEALFPLLRPGGLYLIEDWAWAHWKEFQAPSHPWSGETPLTRLIFELVAAAGSSTELIASMAVFQGFVAIERGGAELDARGGFRLARWIANRPPLSPARRLARAGKRALRRVLARRAR